ncbi:MULTISPECIES: pentapeptide repeat-containing protein [unclassified Streptomyces]|uniref:pentapeptide repeat-containing protein n=1 Tax=unclassified Streptomyces TaxID=2593676 RepID=UPI002E7FC767|nr:pentapeptide repeat-containing protein [Streptomyces sp. NBC_00589]WTI38264.1 pentapeptide repeat-containing protein [Streptomyces sp. NBC_00775]WUB28057.1 pentapeptide repeat-containing protein [Streptomyces sp. NBC_00589]
MRHVLSLPVTRYALVIAVIIGVCLFLLGPAAWQIAGDTVRDLPARERPRAIDDVRRTLLVAVGGAAGLTGLAYSVRTYYLSRRGQVTDRFARATTALSSGSLVERLGGIFALEHVMRESPRDHETVVQILAAFVRSESPVRPGRPPSPVREDVAAAMTVLARRPLRDEKNPMDLRRADLTGLELLSDQDGHGPRLSQADLCGARLTDARMPGADLRGVWLGGADLTRADLQGVDLSEAWLSDATLRETKLQKARLAAAKLDEATLYDTHFTGAVLTGCRMDHATQHGAWFSGAELTGAWLQDVNLYNSQGLTTDQLLSAACLERTALPQGLRRDPRLLAGSPAWQSASYQHLPDHPFPWPVSRADRGGAGPRRRRARTGFRGPLRPRH